MAKLVIGVNDLATVRPDLAKEWNYDKNGDLTPEMVTCGSEKRVWWKCEKGHEWKSIVYHRTNGRNCPICSGQQVLKGFNDLATLRPDLAAEWHHVKNGKLTPEMVTLGSNKKVWWICEKGHEWKAIISSRALNGSGCPVCSGHQVLAGYNDLATLRPDLIKEWNYERNGNLTPDMVTCGSMKKVWWKCEKGHEWKSEINSRVRGCGCPICSGHQVLAGFNDLASLRPDIAKEWNYKRNGNLTPDMVTCGSMKKVWWKCEKGHEWESTVNNRTIKRRSCPICAGQKVLKGYNDLKTLNPDIAKEWNYERNGDLTPEKVTLGSNKKVWWKCEKGHEWKAIICSRTNMNSGCPICSGKQVLKGFNDLSTLRPDLAAEWHPTKNGELKPFMVTCGSHKHVWWKCEKGHEWEAVIYSRTDGNDCPICAKEREVSFPEKILAFYLRKILPIKENVFIGKWNVDILIENVVIEYDGEYFHSKSVEKDNLKNKDLESEGYIVIRILGRDESNYVKKSDFRYEIQESNHEHFKTVIKDLCNYLCVDYPDVDIKRDEKEIRKLMDGY